MGEVIPLPRRPRGKSDTEKVLIDFMAQEASGELEGAILIANTRHGAEFHALGAYADRLQLGVLALVNGLSIVCEQIVATGSAGNTRSDSVSTSWPAPKRRLPRRLVEVTKLGDLE